MELIVSRLPELHFGMQLALKDLDEIKPIAIINGNKADFSGPVILFNLDQHIVYGMSHPAVISVLQSRGPQNLITTKELAHNLFEHGMKAALGEVRINNNTYATKLDTFYTVIDNIHNLKLIAGKRNRPAVSVWPREDYKPLIITTHNWEPKEKLDLDLVEIDNIKTYASFKFETV